VAVDFQTASQDAQGNATHCTAAKPTGTVSGDLLLAFHMSDRDGSLASMTAPDGTWTLIGSDASVGGETPYLKIWQKIAGGSEPTSYTFQDATGANSALGILRFTGHDPTNPLVASPSITNTTADSASHVANSVTGVAGGMLVTAHFGETGGTTRSYTGSPAGMTERVDAAPASGGWVVLGVFTEPLAAGGATGTRTATCSAATPYATAALVIAPAGQTVSPSGIGSVAAVGSPTVSQGASIAPLGIASPAAVGAPTVVPGTVSVSPGGVASPAAVGAPSLTMIVAPPGIASPAAVGTPTVTAGPRPPLRVDWWALADDGSILAPLPQPVAWDLSLIPGEPGAVRLEYPVDGLNYDLINARVNRDRDLFVHIRTDGTLTNALGAVLQERDGDQIAEGGTVTFTGAFMTVLLKGIALPYNAGDPKGETTFAAANAGEILDFVLDRVVDAGDIGSLTWSFTGAVDSNGTPWPSGFDVSPTFTAGISVLEICQLLRDWGLAEFEVTTAREIRLYVPETVGVDRTTSDPPIVLRKGRDLLESPRRTTVRDSCTDLIVTGGDGVTVRVFDASARARRGRRVVAHASDGNLKDTASATVFANAELARRVYGRDEITHELTFDQNHPTPLRELYPADWVYTDPGSGGIGARERIVQLTVSQRAGEDRYAGGVVLHDLLDERELSLQRQIDRLRSGSTVVGTSEPPVDDGLAPAAPTGLVVTSSAYHDGFDVYAVLIVDWNEVTTNSNGSAATDVAGYRVQWRPQTDTTGWRLGADVAGATVTATSFGGVGAGIDVVVRVAAYDRDNNQGAWSAEVIHLTQTDTTPPPVPSTPVVTPYLGQLKIAWNGLGSAGEAMPGDLDHVEVHLSTTSGFTPSTATLVDTFSTIAGERVITDLTYGTTYFVRLVAVDNVRPTPNRSGPSAQASGVPEQLVQIDIGPNAIGRQQIIDLEVVTAKIANLAVNNAKISDLDVGKLTAGVLNVAVTNAGIIRSGISGQRYELDAAALRFYDSGGSQTVQLNGAFNWIMGELRTGLSGTRMVVNPGGNNQDRIDFYPSSGSARAYLQTRTFVGQALIDLVGGSTRGDLAAGQAGAHPLEGYIRWGLPESVNPYSFAVCRETNLDLEAPHMQIAISERYPGPNSPRRIDFIRKNSTGGLVTASQLRLLWNSGGYPWLAGIGANVGIVFQGSNGRLGVVNNAGNSAVAEATQFVDLSDEATKYDVEPLEPTLGADLLDIVEAITPRRYRMRGDRFFKPAPTPEDPDPPVIELPADQVPMRVGVLANDLPEALRERVTLADGTTAWGIGSSATRAVMFGALRRLLRWSRTRFETLEARAVRSVAARVATPALAAPGVAVPVDVTWPGAPLPIVPDTAVVTREGLTVGQSARITTTVDAVTAAGCRVWCTLDSGAAVAVNAGILQVTALAWR
jgi:hypothetical protein